MVLFLTTLSFTSLLRMCVEVERGGAPIALCSSFWATARPDATIDTRGVFIVNDSDDDDVQLLLLLLWSVMEMIVVYYYVTTMVENAVLI